MPQHVSRPFTLSAAGHDAATAALLLAAAPPAVPHAGVFTLQREHLAEGDDIAVDDNERLIRNVSVMSVGPAAGHGFSIDQTTLATLLDALTHPDANVVSRLTHPEVDWTGGSDGAIWLLGRPENPRIDGDRLRCDVRIGQYADLSPNGQLGKYTLSVAQEDPRAIGISVVAYFDFDEVRDPSTGHLQDVLARVTYCKAVDFVGDPATNRQGLLSTPAASTTTQDSTMNRVIKYLQRLGKRIAANASRAQVDQAVAALDASQQRVARFLLLDKGDDATAKDGVDFALRALGLNPDDPTQKLATPNAPDTPAASAPQHNTPGAYPAGTPPSATATSATPPTTPAAANTPADPTTPAPAQPLSAADVERLVNERVAAGERARQTHLTALRNLADLHGLGDDFVEQHRDHGDTARANQAALDLLATRDAPVQHLHGRVTGGEDGRASLAAGIHDALLLRLGIPLHALPDDSPTGNWRSPARPLRAETGEGYQTRQASDRAPSLERLSILEICRLQLRTLGVDDTSLDRYDAVQACFDRQRLAGLGVGGVALSHSTSDFPSIFANVLNKSLLPQYEEEPSTWELWADEREVNDFRPNNIIAAGNIQTPPRVMEGAEYTYGTLGEKHEILQAFKYGILFSWTWEMMVHDDLGAFDRAFGFAQGAKALENDLVYDKVTGNPTMNEDNTALFHSNHNNLNPGGAAAPGIDSFNEMFTGMALQKGVAPKAGEDGRVLNLRMNTILSPFAQSARINQIVASTVKPGGTNNEPNYNFVRNLRVVEESRLDADSTTAYYGVAAKRRAMPAMLVAKLRGYRSPTIERLDTMGSVDGMTAKLRHVAGATPGDFRPWQKNAGA